MEFVPVDSVVNIVIPAFLISAGIVFYLAIQAVVVGIAGRRVPHYLAFASVCLCVAGFQLATVVYYTAASVEAASYALHWQAASVLAFNPAFFAFIALYTGQRHVKPWLIIVATVFGLLLILSLIMPYSLRFSTLEADGVLRLPWGEQLARFKGTPNVWNGLVRLANLSVFIWASVRTVIQYRRGEQRLALFLAACLAILFASGLQGGLIDLRVIDSFYTGGVAFLCLAVLMSISMGMELRERTLGLESASADLRGMVGQLQQEISERQRAMKALKESEERFRTLVEHAPEAIVVLDVETKHFVDANDNAVRLFGLSKKQLFEVGPIEMSPKVQADDRLSSKYGEEMIQKAINGENLFFEWVHRNAAGEDIPCLVYLVRLPATDRVLIRGSIVDITDRKRSETLVAERLKFEAFLSDLSMAFLDIPAGRVDSLVQDSLQRIVEQMGFDRTGLAQASYGNGKLQVTHSYAVPSQRPVPLLTIDDTFPWYREQIRQGRMVVISEGVQDLPDEAVSEKEFVTTEGIQSHLGLPLMVGGTTVGTMGFATLRAKRTWSEETIQQLQLIGEIFANALHRKQTQELLEERLRFEKLLADMSSEFVNVPVTELDAKINACLRSITEFLDVDRASIGVTSEDGQESYIRYSYTVPGIQPLPKTVLTKLFPWYTRMLMDGKIVVISKIPDDFPDEAESEKAFSQKEGIKSTLIIPLEVGGSIIGGMGFASYRTERDWPQDLVQRLKLVGEVFANALARKRTEEALRESEQNYRTVVENQTEFIVRWLPDGTRTFVNDAYCRYFGQSREQVIGTSFYPLITPEDQEAVRRRIRLITPENPISTGEHRSIDAQGRKRWQQWTDHGFFDEKGQIVELQSVGRDITERKRAEEALQRAMTEVEKLKNRIEAEKIYLQDEIKVEHNFEEMIGGSPNFKKVLRQVEQVASTDSTVLILGETGTGKELIARAIHNISPRHDRTLVKVNCASLAETLIESELFGHEKGAFTGALSRTVGRFELADGGTIFLDEIGDLSLDVQAKLLRVLQEGEFERVGDPKTHTVNVRVIAATNRELKAAVRNGSFRNDLYFRLNVFPIQIPPLRDRREDIPALVKHFVSKYGARLGKPVEKMSKEFMAIVSAYHWPGNIRELENFIERAIILNEGPTLQWEEQLDLRSTESLPEEKTRTLKENEQFLIRKALEESNWIIEGKQGAAARLDIPSSTLRDRMQKYGIKKPARRI